jgi:hypothetical protein
MIGPLPIAPGGFNRVLVAIDKFTKWIKVKPVTCPKADSVLDGYQDRQLGGPLGLLGLCHTAPDGVGCKDYGGEVLG